MSKIEWTDKTWNPFSGCTPISAGCDNCYAAAMAKRLHGMRSAKYIKPGAGPDGFNVQCHPEELERDFGKKSRVFFVGSMGDLFHKNVSRDFIVKIFNVMRKNPKHTFILLTKRPRLMMAYATLDWAAGTKRRIQWPNNVWTGITIENEDNLWRLQALKYAPYPMKFLSIEPLLGPMPAMDLSGIDWVIVGGESGPGARPMHPDWARGIRDQCAKQGVPFFFKGWGAFIPYKKGRDIYRAEFNKATIVIPDPIHVSHYTGSAARAVLLYKKMGENIMRRVGKKKAGRELDGRTWDEMPEEARR